MGKAKRKSSQPAPASLIPLLEPLAALQRLLDFFMDRGVIIGGIAASLLGQPRLNVSTRIYFYSATPAGGSWRSRGMWA